MKLPELLKIEITSRCNGKCVFCLHSNYKGMDMDFDMFTNIVDSFPSTKIVQPQFFGEPTLYPRFVEVLKYLKDKDKIVEFYTNGSFPLNNLKEIAEANPDRIIFSIEADSESLYKKIRKGLDWNVVLKNIIEFKSLSKNTQVVVRMTICKENKNRINEIKKFWENKVDNVIAVPEACIKRGEVEHYNKYVCVRPLNQFVVKANGNVVLCCTDWLAEYVVGHVKDGCLKVWNSDKLNKLKMSINTENEPKICKKCGFKTR